MSNFVEKIAKYVQKYAPAYDIKVFSPIIAQAILESGWGKSELASRYHNYFGLKCGSAWTGKSVNMTTKEEYTPGTITTIRDNFRVYDSMEKGVKGYFEFIRKDRYKNLKGISDPKKYLETIKADGYATSSNYVNETFRLVEAYGLTKYDPKAYSGAFPKLPSRGWYIVGDGYNTNISYASHIERVQKLLNWILEKKLEKKLAIDGKYGKKTSDAVKQLQRMNGLSINGKFGKLCLKICKEYRKFSA